jgi:hypothetical protein
MPGSHPNGYYTATKSQLINGKQGKWYSDKQKKSDEVKKSFSQKVTAIDADAGPVLFTTNFTARAVDTLL